MHGIARFHRMKRKERVRTLLKVLLDEAGLDVNAQREGWSDGNTALHLACERGNHVVAEVLIELGATRSLLNTWGKCIDDDQKWIVELLLFLYGNQCLCMCNHK